MRRVSREPWLADSWTIFQRERKSRKWFGNQPFVTSQGGADPYLTMTSPAKRWRQCFCSVSSVSVEQQMIEKLFFFIMNLPRLLSSTGWKAKVWKHPSYNASVQHSMQVIKSMRQFGLRPSMNMSKLIVAIMDLMRRW